ncbi:response regulator [Arachidicoccus sp.]|uniref:response regulator n=1 Tax=Arachidicoccus sp. TaxID=1872624 RepID=UPI003D201843
MANILIADDHPVVLLGIKTYLEQKGYNVAATCDNGIEAYNQILAKQPSIALLDISMPGMTGLEILKKLSETKSRTKVVLITLQNELSVFNYAKQLGVRGFLLKEFAMNEMEKCLEEVQNGNIYFSEQLNDSLHHNAGSIEPAGLESLTFSEKKILQLISEQKSSKEIASILFISEKTVETHRSHIMKKLDIPSGKNALLKWAIENGK